MAEVLRSPSQLPLSPRRALPCSPNDDPDGHLCSPYNGVGGGEEEGNSSGGAIDRKTEEEEGGGGSGGRDGGGGGGVETVDQLSLLALLLTVLRKSLLRFKTAEGGSGEEDLRSMEIGWPTDVRHVAHVTFDRFNGFLGLPVEFQPEVPSKAPSASTTVFGVSTESMQCSYDSRGNSVPTILLLMQKRLYEQGGLQAEGIFRITAENSQEEYARDRLNNGIVLEDIDVHCLAGLIKAWFRELPTGVLDSLSAEQVMQCETEEDCVRLARLLPTPEAALLDWGINLMADVVQEEHLNKMNARNIATVFAPNMTQMADPLTALMYAVQVMNFLRMLILRTLKEREDKALLDSSSPNINPSDQNGREGSQLHIEADSEEESEVDYVQDEPVLDCLSQAPQDQFATAAEADYSQTSGDNDESEVTALYTTKPLHENPANADGSTSGQELPRKSSDGVPVKSRRTKTTQTNRQNHRKGRPQKGQSTAGASMPAETSKEVSIVSRINSRDERVEAWR